MVMLTGTGTSTSTSTGNATRVTRSSSRIKPAGERPCLPNPPRQALPSRPIKRASESPTKQPSKIAKLVVPSDSLPRPDPQPAPPFVLSDARAYLHGIDPRFSLLFDRLPCKPFEQVSSSAGLQRPSNPFQSLSCSILGQQVSCLAARSITYRFIRLFDPTLPERLDPSISISTLSFPSPAQVSSQSLDTLRTAGLSQRKAEYIRDLAERFVDGRLSSMALMSMDAQSVMEKLCAVRGIGKWTVEMFLIFTVKHPDVLPCADLAIQKGILRWYTGTPLAVSPKKKLSKAKLESTACVESKTEEDLGWTALPPPPIPKACPLSVTDLRNRLVKPIKPGLYLTPLEMEQLTDPWKPYRSIPVCYLWSMTDVAPDY